jgi:O-antigen/teichoic acid export membrane protein
MGKKDIAYYFSSKILPALVNVIIQIIIVRNISKEDYGSYTLYIGYAGILNVIFFHTVRISISRFYNENESRHAAFISSISRLFQISFVLFILSILLIGVFYHWFNAGILFLLTLSQGIFEIFVIYFNTTFQARKYLKYNLIRVFLLVIFCCSVVYGGLNYQFLYVAYAISYLFILVFFARSIFAKNHTNNDKKIFSNFISYGIPSTALMIFSVLINFCDRWFIAQFLSKDELAQYNVPYALVDQVMNLMLSVSSILAVPLAIKHYNKHLNYTNSELTNHFHNISKYLVTTGLVLIYFLSISSNELIKLLYGEKYDFALNKLLIPVLAVACLVYCLKLYLLDHLFFLSKEVKKQIIILAIILLIYGACLYLLSPFGIVGVSFATLLSYALGLLVTYLFVKDKIHFKIVDKETVKLLLFLGFLYLLTTVFAFSNEYLNLIAKNLFSFILLVAFVWYIDYYSVRKFLVELNDKLRKK